MSITQLTYVYVEANAAPPTCVAKTMTPDLETYLEQHVDAIVNKNGRIPPAHSDTAAHATEFDRLRAGSPTAFLASAETLARRLQASMDGRMSRGFFVALRRTRPGSSNQAAILKLDVSKKLGAALRRSAGGPNLAVIKDFLDVPGALDKGAVVPDDRATSDVLVGAARWTGNEYFLDSLGIVQQYSEQDSVKQAIAAVRQVAPEKVTVFLERLDAAQAPTDLDDFLADNDDVFDDDEEATAIVGVAEQRRPLQPLNPRRIPLERVITADGIKISGPPNEIAQKVSWTQEGNGWRITINVNNEPR